MTRSEPLMLRAFPETRNTTRAAISAGSVMRPVDIPLVAGRRSRSAARLAQTAVRYAAEASGWPGCPARLSASTATVMRTAHRPPISMTVDGEAASTTIPPSSAPIEMVA